MSQKQSNRRPLAGRSAALAALLCASGCPLYFDLDAVSFKAPDSSVDLDADPADAGSDAPPTDQGRDDSSGSDTSADGPGDAGPDISFGTSCIDDGVPYGGTCDVVRQDCQDEVCELFFRAGDPPQFDGQCVPRDELYDLMEGDECGVSVPDHECVPGLTCNQSRCARLCSLVDGAGCSPGEFCRPVDAATKQFGLCSDSC